MTFEVGPWTLNALEGVALLFGLGGAFFAIGTALMVLRRWMAFAIVGAGFAGMGFGSAGLVLWTLQGMQGPLLEVALPDPVDLSGARRKVHPIPARACFVAVGSEPVCPDGGRVIHHVRGDAPAQGLPTEGWIAVTDGLRTFAAVELGTAEGRRTIGVHPTPTGGQIYGGVPRDRAGLHEAVQALPRDVQVLVHLAPPTTVQDVISACLSARPRPCGVFPMPKAPGL